MSRWIADPAVQVVISSGGTGLAGRDGTPEAVAPLLDKTMEGFRELFRVLSFETIGTSTLQSRCLAGVANGTLVFVLPGSLDAVQTAWDRLIDAQLDATTKPCNLVQLLPRLRESPDQRVGSGGGPAGSAPVRQNHPGSPTGVSGERQLFRPQGSDQPGAAGRAPHRPGRAGRDGSDR